VIYSKDLADKYQTLWKTMSIKPQHVLAVQVIASKILTYRDPYQIIEDQTTVPWPFIAVVHYRESDFDFKTHLHNGDPLTHRTAHVPKGRPLDGNPPFSWEVSAEDALRCEGLATVDRWDLPRYLYQLERYNGWGYARHGLPSAYVFSFSNHGGPGKYVADNDWDPGAIDEQCGCAPILKVLVEQGVFAFPK
jgi:lysozyme family protein